MQALKSKKSWFWKIFSHLKMLVKLTYFWTPPIYVYKTPHFFPHTLPFFRRYRLSLSLSNDLATCHSSIDVCNSTCRKALPSSYVIPSRFPQRPVGSPRSVRVEEASSREIKRTRSNRKLRSWPLSIMPGSINRRPSDRRASPTSKQPRRIPAPPTAQISRSRAMSPSIRTRSCTIRASTWRSSSCSSGLRPRRTLAARLRRARSSRRRAARVSRGRWGIWRNSCRSWIRWRRSSSRRPSRTIGSPMAPIPTALRFAVARAMMLLLEMAVEG